jgi:NAD(P)-dependent dehydrogenase (short-subunit alcohol dehydrogenase family)
VTRGASVVCTGRDDATGARAVAELQECAGAGATATFLQCDFESRRSIDDAAARIVETHPRLDILVHNAAWVAERWQLTDAGVESQFAVNHLAAVQLTHRLLEPLRSAAPARIVVTASQVERGAATDFESLLHPDAAHGYQPNRVYAQTKLANMLFSQALARRLPPNEITVNALHPGVVRTGLLDRLEQRGTHARASGLLTRLRETLGKALRRHGLRAPVRDWAIDTSAGAFTTLAVATAPTLAGVSGEYFADGRHAIASVASRDVALADALWRLSAHCLGLPDDWTETRQAWRP